MFDGIYISIKSRIIFFLIKYDIYGGKKDDDFI